MELREAKVWFFGDRLRAPFKRNATVLLTAVFSALAVAIVALVTTSIFSDWERANTELTHTLRVKSDIEGLVALHVDANTDFLKGLGMTRWTSYAWPVARVGLATRRYDDLEDALHDEPKTVGAIQSLRRRTATWQWQLDHVTASAIRTGDSVAIISSSSVCDPSTTPL